MSTFYQRTIIFNKPYKVMTCFTDPAGRLTLSNYIQVQLQVYPAGRLDYDSEGLMLLTSDGALAHRVAHPRHKMPKTYLVQVEHIPTQTALDQLRRGVMVKGELTKPALVEMLPTEPALFPRSEPIRTRQNIPTAWLKITISEGRKRQVRHMTAAVGHPTLRLVRVAIGPLKLDNLQPGEWRDVTPAELALLRGKS